jgi:hypothetical protein
MNGIFAHEHHADQRTLTPALSQRERGHQDTSPSISLVAASSELNVNR